MFALHWVGLIVCWLLIVLLCLVCVRLLFGCLLFCLGTACLRVEFECWCFSIMHLEFDVDLLRVRLVGFIVVWYCFVLFIVCSLDVFVWLIDDFGLFVLLVWLWFMMECLLLYCLNVLSRLRLLVIDTWFWFFVDVFDWIVVCDLDFVVWICCCFCCLYCVCCVCVDWFVLWIRFGYCLLIVIAGCDWLLTCLVWLCCLILIILLDKIFDDCVDWCMSCV